MEKEKTRYCAIGLMSGTSLDGIDAALLETDGEDYIAPKGWVHLAYDDDIRARVRALFNKEPEVDIARELTHLNAAAVQKLLTETKTPAKKIDVIGYHGQTISHAPERGHTCQMGDGALLAALTGIDVVNDLRQADVKAGGQGAPLVPVYHRAMAASLPKPAAILNIGGVANATYIGADGALIAFDVGQGNALLDDWMVQHTGKRFDEDGQTAAKGKVREDILCSMLSHPYFSRKVPKSLDRNAFIAEMEKLKNIPLENGAATLAAFTVAGIIKSLEHFPLAPKTWLVAGGGRHNDFFMRQITQKLGVPVRDINDAGFNGDATEAEAWAYLAVRSLKNLPITFPMTTGVKQPMTGGVLHHAAKTAA